MQLGWRAGAASPLRAAVRHRAGAPSELVCARFIDEFLSGELQDGTIDCVLSLGAGLDARPWRLPLPDRLRWVEVDFAPILDYKHGILKEVAPRCRIERIIADVNDKSERQRVLETARESSNRVVLLTEGLLFYLPGETVCGLASETAGFHRWILDIPPATSVLLSFGGDSLRQANQFRHETRLEGPAILEAIGNSGWTAAASKTFMKDGALFAIQRMTKSGWVPDSNTARPSPDDPAGVWLFRRTV